jgi:DNA repair protein REV1
MGYADELQAVSVDEALIDVTSAVTARAVAPEEAREDESLMENPDRDPAIEIAEKIRDEVRGLTQGCEGKSLRSCICLANV